MSKAEETVTKETINPENYTEEQRAEVLKFAHYSKLLTEFIAQYALKNNLDYMHCIICAVNGMKMREALFNKLGEPNFQENLEGWFKPEDFQHVNEFNAAQKAEQEAKAKAPK